MIASLRGITLGLVLVVLTGTAARAQKCVGGTGEWVLHALAARVLSAADALHAWDAGARLEWTSASRFSASAALHHAWLGGASLTSASIAGSSRVPIRVPACIAAEVWIATGRALSAGDKYRNVTVPFGVVLSTSSSAAHPISVFVGPEILVSQTDGSLFGFPFSQRSIGAGAQAGVTSRWRRIIGSLTIRVNTLGVNVGPQQLGRTRVNGMLGFRL